MTLHQVFSRFTKDEFPPEKVFCYFNNKLVSIPTKEIGFYDTMYKFLHKDNIGKIPILVVK